MNNRYLFMSTVESREQAVWFDKENNRYEGPVNVMESGLYHGRAFEDTLYERGLISYRCKQLCDIFHVDSDNPDIGIDSSLEHIMIGDNKGGAHLPSVIIQLVPEVKFSSSIVAVKSNNASKVIKRQKIHQDGTFKLIGPGSDVAYIRNGEQVWRKKRNLQNIFFPIDWTATDLILAVHKSLEENPIYNQRSHNIQRISQYMGVLFQTVSDEKTEKVISAYPTMKADYT